MNPNKPDGMPGSAGAPPPRNAAPPDWADGLKKLYDSVVEEPLPDAFKDLLDRLDDTSGEGEQD